MERKNSFKRFTIALIDMILSVAIVVGCLFVVGYAAIMFTDGNLLMALCISVLIMITWIVMERL